MKKPSFLNPAHTLGWGSAFLAVAWAVSLVWIPIQAALLTVLPSALQPLSLDGTQLGLVTGMVLLMSGALSQFHPLRVGLYALGALCFLTSLVFQQNVGNVMLELSLVLLTGRSFLISLRGGITHSVGNSAAWTQAVLGGGACYLAACWVAAHWPVGPGTEVPGDSWGAIARAGAIVIYGMVLGIEAKILDMTRLSHQRVVAVLQVVGSALLACSNIGQYNAASVVLNVTLGLFGVVNLGLSFRRPAAAAILLLLLAGTGTAVAQVTRPAKPTATPLLVGPMATWDNTGLAPAPTLMLVDLSHGHTAILQHPVPGEPGVVVADLYVQVKGGVSGRWIWGAGGAANINAFRSGEGEVLAAATNLGPQLSLLGPLGGRLSLLFNLRPAIWVRDLKSGGDRFSFNTIVSARYEVWKKRLPGFLVATTVIYDLDGDRATPGKTLLIYSAGLRIPLGGKSAGQ